MINRYDIFRIQLLQFQILCCEAIERIYARDKLGQFAKTNQDKWEQEAKNTAFDFARKESQDLIEQQFSGLSPEVESVLRTTQAYQSTANKVGTVKALKQNVYPALGVTNPELMDSALNAGMNSPEFIKNVAMPIGLISNVAPHLDELSRLKSIKEVKDFTNAQIEQKQEEYEKNILQKGAVTLGKSYLRHQQNMDKMRHLEDYGETEWVGQMGRLGAFGVDAAWNITTLLGTAAIPELMGGARTLEALAPAVQKAAEKRVVIPGIIKETYDITKEGLNEKPENVMLAFTTGAMTGKVLEEANAFAEENPEAAQKAKNAFNEIKTATEKANEFTVSVDEAMKKTGADELFKQENLTLDEFVGGAKDIYQAIPQEQRRVIDVLSNGASAEILN